MNITPGFPLPHFFITLILSLILILFSSQNRLAGLSSFIHRPLAVAQRPFLATQRFFVSQTDFLRQLPHLYRQVKDLERRNNQLASQAQRVSELEAENARLYRTLNVPSLRRRTLLPVKITAISRFAFLNRGSADGLKEGLPLVEGDVLLGVIDSLTDHSARVKLLTDPDFATAGITSSLSSGQLKFRQDRLELSQILQKDPLSIDDRVFTKGNQGIPDNLLIGTVSQIVSSQSDIYQTAIVTPAATVLEQDTVLVILD